MSRTCPARHAVVAAERVLNNRTDHNHTSRRALPGSLAGAFMGSTVLGDDDVAPACPQWGQWITRVMNHHQTIPVLVSVRTREPLALCEQSHAAVGTVGAGLHKDVSPEASAKDAEAVENGG